jgi:hypothetical protein
MKRPIPTINRQFDLGGISTTGRVYFAIFPNEDRLQVLNEIHKQVEKLNDPKIVVDVYDHGVYVGYYSSIRQVTPIKGIADDYYGIKWAENKMKENQTVVIPEGRLDLIEHIKADTVERKEGYVYVSLTN